MRRIGNLPGESQAHRFCDYLQTQSIDGKASSTDESAPPASTQHDIWIRHEHDVPRARELFAEFEANPAAKEYDVSAEAARQRKQRSQQIAQKIAAQKKSQMQLRRNMSSGLGGPGQSPASIPLTIGFVVLATVIGFVTNFGALKATDVTGIRLYDALSCVDFATFHVTGDLMASIKRGEVWRVFTPMLLHGSMMHLAFNMLNLVFLGGVVERIHGHWFFLFLLLVCGGIGTLTQIMIPNLWGSNLPVVGASGGVLGIFGFIWIRPYYQQNYPVEIPAIGVIYMLGFIALCFTPMMGNIANGAHIGGLLTGMLVAVTAPQKS